MLLTSQYCRFFLTGMMLILGVLLTGCGIANWMGGDTVTLWANKYEFVRIQPQGDGPGRPPPPNQQPVAIAPGQISGALRLLLVRAKPGEEPQPLFSEAILKKLGSYISQGLAEAGPRQDVTFAIEDWYKGEGLFGITGNKVVSARVFYTDNRLNIIFGSVLRDGPMAAGHAEMTARNPDPRINPFIPGRRAGSIKSSAMLSAPPGSGVFKQAGGRRNDWLVFTDQALVARGPVSRADRRSAATTEIQDLRREVQALRQQMGAPGSAPPVGYAPPPATAYPSPYPPGYAQPGYRPPGYPPPGYVQPGYPRTAYPYTTPYPPGYPRAVQPPPANQSRSAPRSTSQDETARRITMLDALRQKGLISQDEYDRKRQAILDGL